MGNYIYIILKPSSDNCGCTWISKASVQPINRRLLAPFRVDYCKFISNPLSVPFFITLHEGLQNGRHTKIFGKCDCIFKCINKLQIKKMF